MPNQITTSAAVTTIAGIIRTTVNDVAPTRAPDVTAPMITASSRAPTRIAGGAAGELVAARRQAPTDVRR